MKKVKVCSICGVSFTQNRGESYHHWRCRQTCSLPCRKKLILERLNRSSTAQDRNLPWHVRFPGAKFERWVDVPMFCPNSGCSGRLGRDEIGVSCSDCLRMYVVAEALDVLVVQGKLL